MPKKRSNGAYRVSGATGENRANGTEHIYICHIYMIKKRSKQRISEQEEPYWRSDACNTCPRRTYKRSHIGAREEHIGGTIYMPEKRGPGAEALLLKLFSQSNGLMIN